MRETDDQPQNNPHVRRLGTVRPAPYIDHESEGMESLPTTKVTREDVPLLVVLTVAALFELVVHLIAAQAIWDWWR